MAGDDGAAEKKEEKEAKKGGPPATPGGSRWGSLKGMFAFGSGEKDNSTKATLGDEMSMYYDEKLKRWVDPSDPSTSEEPAGLAPPPTAMSAPAADGGGAPPTLGAPGSAPAALSEAAAATPEPYDMMAPAPLRKRKPSRRASAAPATPSTPAATLFMVTPQATPIITCSPVCISERLLARAAASARSSDAKPRRELQRRASDASNVSTIVCGLF